MTTIVRTTQVIIQAPLQSVFDYVSDLTKHPEWSGGELRIEAIAPGPIQVGKEYSSLGQVATQKNRPNTVQVTEYAPARVFSFVAKDPDFGNVFHVFNFTEQAGGVLVTRTVTLELKPLVALAFSLFIYPFIGRPSMKRAMSALKRNLEA